MHVYPTSHTDIKGFSQESGWDGVLGGIISRMELKKGIARYRPALPPNSIDSLHGVELGDAHLDQS